MIKNLRSWTRIPFRAKAWLEHKYQHIRVNLKDLSLHGAGMEGPHDIPRFGEAKLVIEIPGTTEHSRVQVEGRVVYKNNKISGFEFDSMPLETFDLLKNIVSFNMENPDQALKELGDNLKVTAKKPSSGSRQD